MTAGDFTFSSAPAPTLTITVETPNGFNFHTEDSIAEMGLGTVQPGGGSTTFTIIDVADDREFVLDGSGFTYGNGGTTLATGTITGFQEFTDDSTPAQLVDLSGFTADAVTWMLDIREFAQGQPAAFNDLTANYSFDVVGGSGPDAFDFAAPSGGFVTLTGGAGSNTFFYGQGYGAVTITDFDQGNTGNFTQTEGDIINLSGVTGVSSFSDLTLTAVDANGTADQNGPDTQINFGGGDILTLSNVTPSRLNASDFSFTAPSSGQTLTITVETPNGYNFRTDDPITEMGTGTVQPGGNSVTFAIVDAAADRESSLAETT